MSARDFQTETQPQDAGLDPRVCFVAAAADGPLLIEADTAVRHAVDAAIALQRCDALLCALEDWTGLALDWRWIEAPSWRLSAGSHAPARWSAEDGSPVALELPWALLRRLPAPPAELAARLEWAPLPALLAVSQPRLAADELSALEPGGAVLLPESFAAPWRGWLRAADEPAHAGFGVAVELASPVAVRLAPAAGATAASDDERIACEVRLGAERPQPADRLAGWRCGETLDAFGPDASLWRCAGPGFAQRLACGRLMPWGDGWALALESVDDDATLIHPR